MITVITMALVEKPPRVLVWRGMFKERENIKPITLLKRPLIGSTNMSETTKMAICHLTNPWITNRLIRNMQISEISTMEQLVVLSGFQILCWSMGRVGLKAKLTDKQM